MWLKPTVYEIATSETSFFVQFQRKTILPKMYSEPCQTSKKFEESSILDVSQGSEYAADDLLWTYLFSQKENFNIERFLSKSLKNRNSLQWLQP